MVFPLLLSVYASAQTKAPITPAEIYDRTHLSVVVIVTSDKNHKPVGQGSGFIIAKDRVVTNHHVFENAANALVFFADGSSAAIDGVVADSAARDLVILFVQTGTRPQLQVGDELSVRQGDPVFAIGAPEGLQLSITNGIVSGFRQVEDQFRIQNTAPIAPGSSGGPLFDAGGRVAGVTTSLLSGAPGIYFSIGAGDVNRLLRTPYTAIISFAAWSATTQPIPTSTSSEIQVIQSLIDEKKYEPAKAQLLKLLESTPTDPMLHKMMGEVNLFQGDNPSALAQLKTALDEKADDSDIQNLYALTLYLTGRFGQAARYQESVVKAEPTDANLGFLAEIYYSEEKFENAENIAQKALEKNPSEEAALSVLAGNAYWRRSNSQFSWVDLESRLAKISQNSFWVKIQRAFELANQKKEKEEIDLLQQAKKDLFNDSVVYVMLSGIYERNNQIGMARDQVQQGLTLFPDNPTLLSTAVAVDLLSHDETSAYRNASHLIEVAPGSREELYSSCLYTYGTEKAALAVENCTKLAQTYPSDHTALSNLGWAALDASQFSLASQKFGEAYKLVAEKWNTLTPTQVVDLVWGTAISAYYTGDKKGCKKLLLILRKDYPSTLTVTGLQQLPLIWSKTTMTRIESILRDLKP